jgi:hypothetical protein
VKKDDLGVKRASLGEKEGKWAGFFLVLFFKPGKTL